MANSNDNRPHQSSTALGIRAVVLLYVLYLVYGIVAAYVRGDSDALSLPMTILVSAGLGAASLLLLVLTYRQWKEQSAGSDEAEPSDDLDEREPSDDSDETDLPDDSDETDPSAPSENEDL